MWLCDFWASRIEIPPPWTCRLFPKITPLKRKCFRKHWWELFAFFKRKDPVRTVDYCLIPPLFVCDLWLLLFILHDSDPNRVFMRRYSFPSSWLLQIPHLWLMMSGKLPYKFPREPFDLEKIHVDTGALHHIQDVNVGFFPWHILEKKSASRQITSCWPSLCASSFYDFKYRLCTIQLPLTIYG